jgi:hypothetical protein
MQKGKVQTVRNDDFLKVRERRFRLDKDPTIFVAQVSYQKKALKGFPKKKELWVGYYSSTGMQLGLGFFKTKAQIPQKYRSAFAGLDIKVGKRKE